jgi:NAD(P)H-nitrite reductase large subunit
VVEEETKKLGSMNQRFHRRDTIDYVIIGNSAAGIAAAREIRRHDSEERITIVSDESAFGYSRVLLPLYIAGKIRKKDMVIAPLSFYSSNKIRLLRQETVQSIDSKNQRIETERGATLAFDRLLIATGASPRKLGVPGEGLEGIQYLRKIADAEAIRSEIRSSKDPILVVGGGLVSVKSMEALIARRKKVHLVISSDRILSQMIDQTASDFFLKTFERHGVRIHLHADVKTFEGKQKVQSAILSDGTNLPCSFAIIGKGVHPNIDLLRKTDVSMNQGVVVDQHMATGLPSIYAAGDVVEQFDTVERAPIGHPLWPMAVEGGRVAGMNMAGVPAVFTGALRMNSVEILGTRVVTAGKWEGGQEVQSSREGGTIYRKLVFEGSRLQGFVLAGDIRGAGILTSLIRTQTELSVSMLEEGLERGFSYWPRLQTLAGHVKKFETVRSDS